MSGSAFAVTHHAFSSGAGRTSDGNGSHASTLKSPSYTKSASWQHYPLASIFNSPLLDGKALTEIFTQAKARQMIICADMIKPRLNETLDDICEALSYVDYLFPNFAEAKLLTGKETLDEIADCFLACGVKTVVIKTGKDGCFIKRGDMTMKVPAVAGITAIDTIGAGDNFASGFIAALLEGKNLRECARFANATAAISVLSVGATTGVKNRKLVEQLLEEYEG